MPRSYWLISDTHFSHKNILGWGREQFHNVEHMNEHMIERWNSVVKPGDNVYHLGDFWMGPSTHEERAKLIARLAGRKTLIVGNHDDIPYMAKGGWFRKIEMWKVMKDFKMLLTHVPIHQSCLQERLSADGGRNVHGHIHLRPSPEGPYKCVCVEQIDYTPVNMEELRDSFK